MQKIKSRDVLKFFFNCLRGTYFYVIYIIFAAGYWGFDSNLRPYIIKKIINIIEISNHESIIANVKFWVLLFILTMVLRFFVLRLSSYIRVTFFPKLKIQIMNYFMKDIIYYLNVMKNNNISNLSNIIQEIAKKFSVLVNLIFINSVAHILALIFALISFFYISIYLFYILMLLISLFFLISFLAYKKGVVLSFKENASEMEIFAQYNDILTNIFHIKVLNNHIYEETRLDVYYNSYKYNAKKRLFFDFILTCLLSGLFIFYHVFCLISLIYLFKLNYIKSGDICSILLINSSVPECLWSLVDDLSNFSDNIGAISKLLESLQFNKTLCIDSFYGGLVKLDSYSIEFKDVDFGYNEKSLFTKLSFEIKNNSKIGIIGYSGSGKSTIISLLLNLCKANSGSINIGGININNFDANSINSLITVMTQDLSLFNRTIRDNIAYSDPKASDEDIKKAAKLANIDEFIESLPDKYDTLVKTNGKEFSHGQKQRILIARAFLKNTPILILDEATSSLDNASENIILKSLHELMANRTVIVIAHKLYILKNMDKLIMLNNGELVAQGSHDELIVNNKEYADFYNKFELNN